MNTDINKDIHLKEIAFELREGGEMRREYQEWVEPSENEIIRPEDVEIINGDIFIQDQEKMDCIIAQLSSIPEHPGQSLQETINEYMIIKELTPKDVYTCSNIDRKFWSKIMQQGYTPKKATLFALCIGLQLTRKEAGKLMASAGFVFSQSLRLDMVVEKFILHQIYSIYDINKILFDIGLTQLGSKDNN